MKQVLVIAGILLVSVASSAQTTPNVPATPGKNAAANLSAETVRQADFVGVGLLEEADRGGKPVWRLKYPGYKTLKGNADIIFGGIFPATAGMAAPLGEQIVFAAYDTVLNRVVVRQHVPASAALLEKVQQWVSENPVAELTLEPAKSEYELGEAIEARYTIKNLSGKNIHVFTGEQATSEGLSYGGASRSSTDMEARKRPLFVPLAPGETWKYSRLIPGPFPEGRVELSLRYDTSEALYSAPKPLPANVFFARKRASFELKILPASKSQTQELMKDTRVQRWDLARDAAALLFASQEGAATPEARALACHPWAQIRMLAVAPIVASSVELTPALRALLYDSDRQVRSETASRVRYRNVKGTALAVLALQQVEQEAREKGLTNSSRWSKPEEEIRSQTNAVPNTPALGTILAARMKAGQDTALGVNNAYLLDRLTTRFLLRTSGEVALTAEQRAQTLAQWETLAATVGPGHTLEEYEKELALARKAIYKDYAVGPAYTELSTLVDEASARSFWKEDSTRAADMALARLAPEAGGDLLNILRWRSGKSTPKPLSESALAALGRTRPPGAWEFLLSVAYDPGSGSARYYALRVLSAWDSVRARPHQEGFFSTSRKYGGERFDYTQMAAAISLAAEGQKRAVPVLLQNKEFFLFVPYEERQAAEAALETVTGKKFANLEQWSRWWEAEGKNLNWA